MKNIALALSAFALVAFSGLARAEEPAKADAPKTEKASKKTTKKSEKAADGSAATTTETKTEKTTK